MQSPAALQAIIQASIKRTKQKNLFYQQEVSVEFLFDAVKNAAREVGLPDLELSTIDGTLTVNYGAFGIIREASLHEPTQRNRTVDIAYLVHDYRFFGDVESLRSMLLARERAEQAQEVYLKEKFCPTSDDHFLLAVHYRDDTKENSEQREDAMFSDGFFSRNSVDVNPWVFSDNLRVQFLSALQRRKLRPQSTVDHRVHTFPDPKLWEEYEKRTPRYR